MITIMTSTNVYNQAISIDGYGKSAVILKIFLSMFQSSAIKINKHTVTDQDNFQPLTYPPISFKLYSHACFPALHFPYYSPSEYSVSPCLVLYPSATPDFVATESMTLFIFAMEHGSGGESRI